MVISCCHYHNSSPSPTHKEKYAPTETAVYSNKSILVKTRSSDVFAVNFRLELTNKLPITSSFCSSYGYRLCFGAMNTALLFREMRHRQYSHIEGRKLFFSFRGKDYAVAHFLLPCSLVRRARISSAVTALAGFAFSASYAGPI